MLAAMRWISTLLLFAAAPAAAQVGTVDATLPPGAWNPAADYITIGQDELGYRGWYMAGPQHANRVKAFNAYLAQWEVAGIVPTWQLLRTATSWQRCGGSPFEVPPATEWPHIVQTLRYVRDYVVPAIGPVEPVSAYRNPALNVCAGGAPESAHKHYSAIDMVPLRPTTREELMRTLCRVQARRGPDYQVGLGFYAFLRFHVDTTKYRRWNMDPAVASHCPPIAKPVDIATVAQPIAAVAPAAAAPAAADRQSAPPPAMDPVPASAATAAPVTVEPQLQTSPALQTPRPASPAEPPGSR
jgi:hypothetical protein